MRYLLALILGAGFASQSIAKTDLSASLVSRPDTACENREVTFTIELKNNGKDSLTGIPLEFFVSDNSGILLSKKDTADPEIKAGNSIRYNLFFYPIKSGLFKVTAYHTIADDSVSSNDTVSFYVYIKPKIASLASRVVNVCKGDSAFAEVITDYKKVEWYDLRYPTRPPVNLTKMYKLLPIGFMNKVQTLRFKVVIKDTVLGVKCDWQDTLTLNVYPRTAIELGADHLICPGDSAILDAGCPECSHLWSTGDTTQKITVRKMGLYKAWITSAGNGCVSADSVFVDSPTPDISSYTRACEGAPVYFDAGYAAASYSWDFGDQHTSTDAKPFHIYSNAGDYTVTLRVTKGQCTRQVSQVIHVYPKISADFTFTGQCVLDTVQFSAGTDADTSGALFTWNFGDGHSGTGMVVTHVYPGASKYNVTLTVVNKSGCQADTSKPVIIHNPPNVDFTISDSILTAGAGYNYEWYLGNTRITGATGQIHIAKATGMYRVSYENDKGCRGFSSFGYVHVAGTSNTIEVYSENSMSVYPNPGRGLFIVERQSEAPVKLVVSDALGRIQFTENISTGQAYFTVDLSGKPAGVYIIRIENNGRIGQAKVMKL